MMSRTINVGVVGMRLGQWHIETIQALGGAEIVAVAENNPAGIKGLNLTEYAESLGAEAYEDGIAMIEKEELDAVCLCVSPKWRAELLRAAVAKGVAVLVEKPWATDLQHGRELAAIARGASAPIMIEFPLRFTPPVQRLKALIDDGTLGRPYVAAADLQMGWLPPAGHWAWDRSNGNGIINENGCHIVDTVAFLLGRPVALQAYGGNYAGNGRPLEDAASMSISFENSASATVSAGCLGAGTLRTPTWLNVYTEHGQGLVTGTEHTFDTLRWARRDAAEMTSESHEIPPRRQIMRYSMQHFLECVRDAQQPSCGIDEGLIAVAVADAVRTSIAESRPVTIAPIG